MILEFDCIFSLILVSFFGRIRGDVCAKTSSCSCKYENGDVIDLHSLSSQDGPRYTDVPSVGPDFNTYSWNPCLDFTEGDCKLVALCEIHSNIPSGYTYSSLGSSDSAEFSNDAAGNLFLNYTNSDGTGTLRLSSLKLICADEDSFTPYGEESLESNYFDFEVTSRHACRIKGRLHLSVGSIILIVFCSFIFVYIVVGVVVQSLILKEKGIKRLPNVSFWSSLPGLVKDGVVFVVRRGKISTSRYSSI